MVWVGLSFSSMPPLTGWQAQLAVSLQHGGQVITNALSPIPNWAAIILFLALLGGLSWYALRQVMGSPDEDEEANTPEEAQGTEETERAHMKEEPIEY
jgi:hypothetical protein